MSPNPPLGNSRYAFLNSSILGDMIYFIKWSTSYRGQYLALPTKIDPVIADKIDALPQLSDQQKDLMINVTWKKPFQMWYKYQKWDVCKNYNIKALAAFLSIPEWVIKGLPGLALKATLHGGGEEWCLYNQKILETPFLKQIAYLTLTIKPEFLRKPKLASSTRVPVLELPCFGSLSPPNMELDSLKSLKSVGSVSPPKKELDSPKSSQSDSSETEYAKLISPVEKLCVSAA